MGAFVVEFEQNGADRAAYGSQVLEQLSVALEANGCVGVSARNLRNFRSVTLAYPGVDLNWLGRFLSQEATRQTPAESNPQLESRSPDAFPPSSPSSHIRQTSAKSTLPLFPSLARRAREVDGLPWRDAAWVQQLFARLTFSHLLELARIDDATRRAFYELHCLKEGWAVKELQRQKDSLLFERIGLSTNREEVLALARRGVLDESPQALLRDPYVLEFLGLHLSPALLERDLEQALLDHLQQFLKELGREFCFVERQFRITIANRHHHLDLLFFHRRLRCLVAIDLKLGEFQPAHAGQMRFYLNYLAQHVALPDENPPIGILLCSDRDQELVQISTAGDETLFVSRYLLQLPTEEQLKRWLREERALLEQTLGKEDTSHDP